MTVDLPIQSRKGRAARVTCLVVMALFIAGGFVAVYVFAFEQPKRRISAYSGEGRIVYHGLARPSYAIHLPHIELNAIRSEWFDLTNAPEVLWTVRIGLSRDTYARLAEHGAVLSVVIVDGFGRSTHEVAGKIGEEWRLSEPELTLHSPRLTQIQIDKMARVHVEVIGIEQVESHWDTIGVLRPRVEGGGIDFP